MTGEWTDDQRRRLRQEEIIGVIPATVASVQGPRIHVGIVFATNVTIIARLMRFKDIYFAEKKILSALPKMAKAAQDEKLQAAFEKHHGETETHVSRLEQVFDAIDAKPQRMDRSDCALPVSMRRKLGIPDSRLCACLGFPR